ncbi:MAG: DNA-3-methyladenine glycosylase 2 family protein [Clostridiales bacterium]|jgi:DNA-3-methyladenine glycosylase II|nr:DNA-3-methyladenine glycosylase 2 family protein [Clostridiales bacterium]
MNKRYIEATEKARAFLSGRDPVLGGVIERYGVIKYELETAYFDALLSTVIGQQLSGKVADTIWKRFVSLADGGLTPEKVLALSDEKMRGTGVSGNKARYLKNIAQAAVEKRIDFDRFREMTDREIIDALTAVKGIGGWTAEMFLIFSLGREDVFSNGDGGLERAVNNLYGGGGALRGAERVKKAAEWKPYRSIASLYLWKSLENK